MPYQKAPAPPMTPELRESCEKALHVFTTDGDILVGADAVLFVYQTLGWKVAKVGRLPGIVQALEVGYKVVANNRRTFARFAFKTDYDKLDPAEPEDEPDEPR